MNLPLPSRRAGLGALVLLAAALLAGCVSQPVAPAVRSDALPFDQAIVAATDGLVAQTQTLPGFLAKLEAKVARRIVVLDPALDATTGQQTTATQKLDRAVGEHMAQKFESIELLPFRPTNLQRAQLLLTGTLTRIAQAYRIDLALTDLKSGNVIAQSSAVAHEAGVDMSPLAYYRDSPVLVKDQVIDGYVRTTATRPGQRGDAAYLERIAAASLINEATLAYNAERYQDALGQYRGALATPAGEQMRTLNGVYLSLVKLGRTAEAETAFGKVVAFGIASHELGVKFLFNPGSTDFWSDAKVSGPYGMWLRQIAKEANAARACMEIVGHTSRTGSESVNEALSLRRAANIKQRLATESAELNARTKAVGMGFKSNIVGSGTDDAVDALDRRVEFKIVPCGA